MMHHLDNDPFPIRSHGLRINSRSELYRPGLSSKLEHRSPGKAQANYLPYLIALNEMKMKNNLHAIEPITMSATELLLTAKAGLLQERIATVKAAAKPIASDALDSIEDIATRKNKEFEAIFANGGPHLGK